MIEFKEFPKIARLNREIIITEKINGENAALIVDEKGNLGVQSRSRLLTTGIDMHGLYAWAMANKDAIVSILGPGHHYGEWWGTGIFGGYKGKAKGKRFSLFNTSKWKHLDGPLLYCVPELYRGLWSDEEINACVQMLRGIGSVACPGGKAEGIVIYHTHGNLYFKYTLENDGKPKSAVSTVEVSS